MSIWSPDIYLRAWNFAAEAHGEQKVPSTERPYITHVGTVVMELMTALTQTDSVQSPNLAIQCALLHDVVEDTTISYEQIESTFGKTVADGVLALTKNKRLPTKLAQMQDSLDRIQAQPHEIWMVKMADRIANLQGPPAHWSEAKVRYYHQEAILIHKRLHSANGLLAARLLQKIEEYRSVGRTLSISL